MMAIDLPNYKNVASAKAEALLSIDLDTMFYHPFNYTPPQYAEGQQGGQEPSNNNEENNPILIYPNPFQNSFDIQCSINHIFTLGKIEIYGLLNQQEPIYINNFGNTELYQENIIFPPLAISGLYTLIIRLDGIIYKRRLLIKE